MRWDHPGMVRSVRAFIYVRGGFRPVPVYSRNAPWWVNSPGKQPASDGWQEHARMDPPPCCRIELGDADAECLNTGLLGDGLRAVDLDCDDADLAARSGRPWRAAWGGRPASGTATARPACWPSTGPPRGSRARSRWGGPAAPSRCWGSASSA